MKKVPISQAIGMKLGYDITRIDPGKFKGPLFRKGHIINETDLEDLKKIGKEHIYVWNEKSGEIHENDASQRISQAVTGKNITLSLPTEGKITLKSTIRGLFQLNSKLLYKINSIDNITIASLPDNFQVEVSQGVAGVRIVPLTINEKIIKKIEQICQKEGKVFLINEYKHFKIGIITTGNEVYKGLIEDKFGPILKEKFSYFGAEIIEQIFCPDEIQKIVEAIEHFKEQDADIIVLTGGMSVDPDDLTPGAIKKSGANIITYGVPVQPGNMFLLAYSGNTTLMGVPGASLYYKNTILDVVLPRIFVGEILSKKDFIKLGEGGYCSSCSSCQYPSCYFGR